MKVWIVILMSLWYGCSTPITYDIVFQNMGLFDGHADRGIVNAAKAFDLPIGEIYIGSKASFVILNENPLEDIENLRTVYQVWKNGRTNPGHKNQQYNGR